MRHRAGAGLRRAPGLERNNWLSHPAGLRRKRLKRPQIADPLDIQSQHSNAGVVQQSLTDLGQTSLGLIANQAQTGLAQIGKALLDDPRVTCLLYTSPSPRDRTRSRMPSSA